jgi:transposase
MITINPKSECILYFTNQTAIAHRQYNAMRLFFVGGLTAEEVAKETDFAISTVYSLVRDFKKNVSNKTADPFFKDNNKAGRKPIDHQDGVTEAVINLRKKYYSVPDIQIAMDAMNINLSIYTIEKIIREAGFAKLPRRDKEFRSEVNSSHTPVATAPVAHRLKIEPETFSSQFAGLLCIMPYIVRYGIDKIISESAYPQTRDIDRLASILSFVALKLTNVKRYSADDVWCMDRGTGMFAGLTVLPKTAWFSSYSDRVTRDMNVVFLKSLNKIWIERDLISDTVNLDFTAIPYWGDDDPFENNWSGKRNKALTAIQAVLAQDPESGILCYGDTTIRHDREDDVILEFLDFYRGSAKHTKDLKYLVFDSKFTTYQNLNKLNCDGIKFITIRRRSKTLLEHIASIDDARWKKIRIEKANGKHRTITVCEEYRTLKDYSGTIRQVFIKDNGRQRPAILITNDFDISLQDLIRKYSHRWLIETDISEHIDFFHLNRNSSGIVVKVDFDLTMTILAHNLYKLLCRDFIGYSHCEAETIFDKFISVAGHVNVVEDRIKVFLKKKRTLPLLLEQMIQYSDTSYPWLNGYTIEFLPDSSL